MFENDQENEPIHQNLTYLSPLLSAPRQSRAGGDWNVFCPNQTGFRYKPEAGRVLTLIFLSVSQFRALNVLDGSIEPDDSFSSDAGVVLICDLLRVFDIILTGMDRCVTSGRFQCQRDPSRVPRLLRLLYISSGHNDILLSHMQKKYMSHWDVWFILANLFFSDSLNEPLFGSPFVHHATATSIHCHVIFIRLNQIMHYIKYSNDKAAICNFYLILSF